MTGLLGFIKTCKLPRSNLQSLWTDFPPLIMRNPQNSTGPNTGVEGALVSGLSSMLKTCCHPSVTVNWDTVAQNVRHLELSLSDRHDLVLPVTRTILFHSFTSKVSSWEYIPFIETPGMS